jgi:hypothetical protein
MCKVTFMFYPDTQYYNIEINDKYIILYELTTCLCAVIVIAKSYFKMWVSRSFEMFLLYLRGISVISMYECNNISHR